MDVADGLILTLITGGGATIAALAKIQYNALKKEVADITARCLKIEARCDALDSLNDSLSKENAVLKIKEDQLKNCPVPTCHWRLRQEHI